MMTNNQRVVLVSQDRFTDKGPRPQVLMAYEDLNMALRAMNVLALIAKEAGDNADIQFSMWRFDFFKSQALREAAAGQAQQADIIIVAPGNSSGGLTPPVALWLEQWTGRRPPYLGALVAVFDPTKGSHVGSVAVRQLEAAARTTGMDFFCSALERFTHPSAGRRDRPGAIERPAFSTDSGSKRPLQRHIVE